MTIDIVDEKQDIAALYITEILGGGGSSRRHHRTDDRSGVHLTKEHDGIFEHVGFLERLIELIAFADTLADTTVNRHGFFISRHIVNHFGGKDRLAHTGSTD